MTNFRRRLLMELASEPQPVTEPRILLEDFECGDEQFADIYLPYNWERSHDFILQMDFTIDDVLNHHDVLFIVGSQASDSWAPDSNPVTCQIKGLTASEYRGAVGFSLQIYNFIDTYSSYDYKLRSRELGMRNRMVCKIQYDETTSYRNVWIWINGDLMLSKTEAQDYWGRSGPMFISQRQKQPIYGTIHQIGLYSVTKLTNDECKALSFVPYYPVTYGAKTPDIRQYSGSRPSTWTSTGDTLELTVNDYSSGAYVYFENVGFQPNGEYKVYMDSFDVSRSLASEGNYEVILVLRAPSGTEFQYMLSDDLIEDPDAFVDGSEISSPLVYASSARLLIRTKSSFKSASGPVTFTMKNFRIEKYGVS